MGTRQNRLIEAVLTSTHNLYFEQKYEKYQKFLSENFTIWGGKISVYLNRHVFVMGVGLNQTLGSDLGRRRSHDFFLTVALAGTRH